VSFDAATKKAIEMAYSCSHLHPSKSPACDLSRSQGRGGDPILRFPCSPRQSFKARRASFSTMTGCGATSPTSTMAVAPYCVSSITFPLSIAPRARRRGYSTSATSVRKLFHAVALLKQQLGQAATKDMLPMQAGDVTETFADGGVLMRDTGARPGTSIEDGIREFVVWYRDHYKL
jgi:hypothetical protein